MLASDAKQIAMGQPGRHRRNPRAQEADGIALGAPATADEMAVRKAEDVAMGQPATNEQRKEQEIDEAAMGKPSDGP